MSDSSKETENSNFTLVLLILIALINGLDLFADNGLIRIDLWEIIEKRNWVDLLLFPFRIASGWFSFAIYLYFFWIFGSQLELQMGTKNYVAYVLFGYVFVLLGTFFYPLTASYVFFSIFLALAWRDPDAEILFLFIIPMKMKWLAGVSLAFLALEIFIMSYDPWTVQPLIALLFIFANFFLFHAKDILQRIRR